MTDDNDHLGGKWRRVYIMKFWVEMKTSVYNEILGGKWKRAYIMKFWVGNENECI